MCVDAEINILALFRANVEHIRNDQAACNTNRKIKYNPMHEVPIASSMLDILHQSYEIERKISSKFPDQPIGPKLWIIIQ